MGSLRTFKYLFTKKKTNNDIFSAIYGPEYLNLCVISKDFYFQLKGTRMFIY